MIDATPSLPRLMPRRHQRPTDRLVAVRGLVIGGLSLLCTPACISTTGPDLLAKTQQLEDEKADLQRRLALKDEQIQAQTQTIDNLRKYPGDLKIPDLIHVDRIELERLSGGYDQDRDGIDDGVQIHLRMYDQDGYAIRSVGEVEIKFFDLANPEDEQSLGGVALSRTELRQLWLGRFLTSHYTIQIPWSDKVRRPNHRELTVTLTFTDALSGRTLSVQAVVPVLNIGAEPAAEREAS